jgi:hypothetical protein
VTKQKNTKKNKTKKKPWQWDLIHQQAFDNIKTDIKKEVVLAYPDILKPFKIYMDTSATQLGAVITQDNRPITFSSRELSATLQKYNVTKIEHQALVEALKEFNGECCGGNLLS